MMTQKTSLWLVRHAPVTETQGKIYGQADVNCVCNDTQQFQWLVETLPSEAIFVTSALKRTIQTAEAVQKAGHKGIIKESLPGLNEQSFGAWEGLTHKEVGTLFGSSSIGFWAAPAQRCPAEFSDNPGESFYDVCERVSRTLHDLIARYAQKDIVIFAHGGSIRAAIALAFGLLEADHPERLESIFAAQIKNLSLSKINHFTNKNEQHPDYWQVSLMNVLRTI